jgi:TatA/E family protein of Tat protein translocase
MFGTLGTQEIVFIFLLALLLFGPKKLPEIGRTIGKAVTEFRRASNELKTTFENEMKTLEQESESLKQVTSQYAGGDTYNYDYSTYESSYTADSTAASPSTESASATEGAESLSGVAPEGTVARGEETAIAESGSGTPETHESSDSVPTPVPAASDHTA